MFTVDTAAQIAASELQKTAVQFQASIVGYVIMPSHVHALIGLPEVKQLSAFVQTFKSITSRRIKDLSLGGLDSLLRCSGRFRLWQRRFDDVIVTSERQFRIKLEYIHNNPVKDGLIDEAISWKYSSAGDWLETRVGPITEEKTSKWIQ